MPVQVQSFRRRFTFPIWRWKFLPWNHRRMFPVRLSSFYLCGVRVGLSPSWPRLAFRVAETTARAEPILHATQARLFLRACGAGVDALSRTSQRPVQAARRVDGQTSSHNRRTAPCGRRLPAFSLPLFHPQLVRAGGGRPVGCRCAREDEPPLFVCMPSPSI